MDAKHVPMLKSFNEQKMQKVNLFETDRMFCDIYCFEPGQEQKTHTHAGADKIYYVLEGKGTFHIGGAAGDPPDSAHTDLPHRRGKPGIGRTDDRHGPVRGRTRGGQFEYRASRHTGLHGAEALTSISR